MADAEMAEIAKIAGTIAASRKKFRIIADGPMPIKYYLVEHLFIGIALYHYKIRMELRQLAV